MIDPCNSFADLSKITATGVFLNVFVSVPYSKSNELQHFFKYFYADSVYNDLNDWSLQF
jgi:hypothetical protein